MVDYSQYEQALILRQLITPDTPKILVDIGAHDGICGSNSRELLEQGWRGLLVEPLPAVFARLTENSRGLRHVRLVNAACGDRDGIGTIRIGKDGPDGQMGSLSNDPNIIENLTEESVDVPVQTLKTLLDSNGIPDDFGVLLVDTEGWDLTVLEGLRETPARPRIILTEDFGPTDQRKAHLLETMGYRLAGSWGVDSFWIGNSQKIDTSKLHFPVLKLPDKWKPSGQAIPSSRANVDQDASFHYSITGWAWNETFHYPDTELIVSLRAADSRTNRFFPRLESAAPRCCGGIWVSARY